MFRSLPLLLDRQSIFDDNCGMASLLETTIVKEKTPGNLELTLLTNGYLRTVAELQIVIFL